MSTQSGTRVGFAFLTPDNDEARQAFSDVAELIKSTDLTKDRALSHASSFMHIKSNSKVKAIGGKVQHMDDDPATQASFTSLRYRGYYFLDFGVKPFLPTSGWHVGVNWNSLKDSHMDLLLAVSDSSSAKYGVVHRHARLFFDADGALTLGVVIPNRAETLLGHEMIKSGQRSIVTTTSRICFGSLRYRFDFGKDINEEAFQSDLRAFSSEVLQRTKIPQEFSATPKLFDITIGRWWLREPMGQGGAGTVFAAKNRFTGQTAAAKLVYENSNRKYSYIAQEVNILKMLPRHPQLLELLDVVYESGRDSSTRSTNDQISDVDDESSQDGSTGWAMDDDSFEEPEGPQGRPQRAYLIFLPFATSTFSYAQMSRSKDWAKRAFHQVLQGIKCLHDSGLMHRDIRPANIGIVSYESDIPHAVILDYGLAGEADVFESGEEGTTPYRAPEMSTQPGYTKAVDIFACGLVGLQMFVMEGKFVCDDVNSKNGRTLHAIQMDELNRAPVNSIENLLAQMLDLNFRTRISANRALRHLCFSNLWYSGEQYGPSAKQAGRE